MDNQLKKSLDFIQARNKNQNVDGDIFDLRAIDENEQKKIILRIVLDEFSPFYKTYNGVWREKIGINAFDESLAEVKSGKRVIKSYIDHDMSVRGLLSSTNRDGVTLEKVGNEIIMEIPIDENDEQQKRTHEQIKLKEITSNSFIMTVSETKTNEIEKEDGSYEIEQIITKADLISIDPVYAGFYKNNKMIAKSVEQPESQAPNSKKGSIQEEEKGERMFDIIKEFLIKREVMKTEEVEKLSEVQLFEKYNEELRAEMDAKLKEITDAKEQEKLRSDFKATMEEVRKQFDTNTELRNEILKLREISEISKKDFDVKEFRQTLFNGQYVTETFEAFREGVKEKIQQLRAIEDATFSDVEQKVLRSMTGFDADSGSQVIPVLTDGQIISEDDYVIPELEGARRIPLVGEATTKVPVKVDTAAAPTRLNIGDASVTVNMNTVTTELSPKIYSQDFSWNPRLMENLDTLGVDTKTITNGHILGWRKEFAISLLQHIAVTFASLKGADKNLSNYKGGATSDAVIETSTSGAITLDDFGLLENPLIAKYGKSVLGRDFTYYMNSATWTAITALARANANDVTVNVKQEAMTINGINVILNDDFVDGIAAGKHPIVLYRKSNIRVYGGQTIIRDSSEAEWKKRLMSRQVTTLGEMFLADPKFTTRVLKIKA